MHVGQYSLPVLTADHQYSRLLLRKVRKAMLLSAHPVLTLALRTLNSEP